MGSRVPGPGSRLLFLLRIDLCVLYSNMHTNTSALRAPHGAHGPMGPIGPHGTPWDPGSRVLGQGCCFCKEFVCVFYIQIMHTNTFQASFSTILPYYEQHRAFTRFYMGGSGFSLYVPYRLPIGPLRGT